MTDRRQFLLQGASLAASARFARAWKAPAAAPAMAYPRCGPLRGETEDGIHMFRGVPFAQPPTGPLRFRAPQPLHPWREVREATRFAAAAMQPDQPTVQQSEDCLYLNIWAPKNAKALPVFVWVHGGGFTGGYPFDPTFNGSVFAQNGIVCITLAYRLGVLGFLDVSPLLGTSYAGTANNGMQDILMALQWVQNNVSAFGGDPRRVTVGGESAGAKLTDILMSIPSAEPLFQQMISESGGADRVWPLPRAQEIGRAFGATWSSNHALAQLREAPAEQLISAQTEFVRTYPLHFPLRAEVDGLLLKQMPLQGIRQGSTRGKRLLLGTNRDESALFLGAHPTSDPTARDLGNLSVDEFRRVAERYKKVYPDLTPEMRRIRSVTAEEYWVPSIRVADAHVDGGGGEAFVYRLDFSETGSGFPGMAFHSSDLRLVWTHLDPRASPASRALARTIHGAWVSFIQGKAPEAEGLPTWQPYTVTSRSTMLLDSTSRLVDEPQAKELALWQGKLMQ